MLKRDLIGAVIVLLLAAIAAGYFYLAWSKYDRRATEARNAAWRERVERDRTACYRSTTPEPCEEFARIYGYNPRKRAP